MNMARNLHGDPFKADLVILNARVHTMDPSQPLAEAVAIRRNRILATGTSEEIRTLAGRDTRLVDAERKLVLPGFNDAHVHFLTGGFSLTSVDLRPAKSPDEFVRILAAFAHAYPQGRWIEDGNWDHESWPGAPLPTRALVDAVTPVHPVLVRRLDGHMALANSRALQLAGISRETNNPPGGLIMRDRTTQEPTGILKDSAIDLVSRVIPPRSREEKLAAAQAASEYAASLGVTSVTDMSADSDVGIYHELLQAGRLKTRIYAARSIVSWETLAATGLRAPFGNHMLRVGALKGFADGSLGSSTALFFEPYADASETRGLLFDQMLPEGVMLKRVQAADGLGFQVMIHAIGDEANARILDLYTQVAMRNSPRDRRFRIEHAQHLRPQDVSRFGNLKVIASMQPYHAADDGRWCEKRLGAERSKTAYCFRSLLDSGATVAFGSDWTVAPLNPLLGIKAAVTRQTLDGKHPDGWIPEQKISVQDAVNAFTLGSAYAEFAELDKGSITPGKLADLVMLDGDIFTATSTIDDARAVLTVLDGQIVHSRL